MKKIVLVSSLLFFLVALVSCSSPKGLDEAYIIALESLIEETDLEYQVDYISLFINDESISDRDLEFIKKHFEETYRKEIFTYTPEEVFHAGPYGKEKLNMNGMFLYLLDINEDGDKMTFETAKYHTVHGRGALGLKVVIHKEKQGWVLQGKETLWKE